MTPNQIPTPETDKWTGLKYNTQKLIETCRDLERRLTVAREVLESIEELEASESDNRNLNDLQLDLAIKTASEALAQTAPKQ